MIAPNPDVDDYFESLTEDRKPALLRLRSLILEHLPEGFEEVIQYKMPSYVVPHSLFPSGYHCNPSDPLPFLSLASQKSHIALYHMGIYMNPDVMNWFTSEYPKFSKTKLDMGKSCIRFKNPANIPYTLIGELAQKITPMQHIQSYEHLLSKE